MKTPWFEELDYVESPMGPLILQRRRIAALNDQEVYEVKLNDEYLMSSLFYDAEVALAQLVLERTQGEALDIVVGGLGLGYTAAAALQDPRVQHMTVVEALEPVITWHQRGIVPNGKTLTEDTRCQYLHRDFFALARATGFAPDGSAKTFDAILLDIDHTPRLLLSGTHADFYTLKGLSALSRFLKPNGIFGLWSNEPPAAVFLEHLKTAFGQAEGRTITFFNPLQESTSCNGIYLAIKA